MLSIFLTKQQQQQHAQHPLTKQEQVSGFRALLAEVGCQAGQHEVLADTLAKVEMEMMTKITMRMMMMKMNALIRILVHF